METIRVAADETCRHCDTRVNLPLYIRNGRTCQCGETVSFDLTRTPPETVSIGTVVAVDEKAPPRATHIAPRRDENGETAPEHLRNALHLLRHTGHETLAGWGYELDDLEAIRRRIASALKLLEG